MKDVALLPPGWRAGFRRHEHTLAIAWLLLVAGLIAMLTLPASRDRLLGQVQRGLDAGQSRWVERVAEGERLVRAGRYQDAQRFLTVLDRDFPAKDVRHGLDSERERLLLALAEAYVRQDKKGRALETYQRLVAFDPLNYRNHYALALASDHFLSGWALAPEARDAYAAALLIHPSHLPSVRGYIAYYGARGEWPEVCQAWQAYLDAFLVHDLTIHVGPDSARTAVLVTGEVQEVELLLSRMPGPADTLQIETGGFAAQLEQVTLVGALRPGQASRRIERQLFPGAPPTVLALAPDSIGRYAAEAPTAAFRFRVPDMPDGLERVRIRLRLFKPADPVLWKSVQTAFANRLDADGLAAAAARTVPLARAGLADSVMVHREWAVEGMEGRPDERTAFE